MARGEEEKTTSTSRKGKKGKTSSLFYTPPPHCLRISIPSSSSIEMIAL